MFFFSLGFVKKVFVSIFSETDHWYFFRSSQNNGPTLPSAWSKKAPFHSFVVVYFFAERQALLRKFVNISGTRKFKLGTILNDN